MEGYQGIGTRLSELGETPFELASRARQRTVGARHRSSPDPRDRLSTFHWSGAGQFGDEVAAVDHHCKFVRAWAPIASSSALTASCRRPIRGLLFACTPIGRLFRRTLDTAGVSRAPRVGSQHRRRAGFLHR